MRSFLDIDDLTPEELCRVLALAEISDPIPVLDGRGVALIFEKPSSRTRSSAEMAVVQLGGHPVYITGGEIKVDVRESAEDIARTLSCYHTVVGARVFSHRILQRMAEASFTPMVNLLSDRSHPLQALADVLTLKSALRQDVGLEQGVGDTGGKAGLGLEGKVLAYVGDSNNVARSLTLAAGFAGMSIRIASPAGYGFSENTLDHFSSLGCDVVSSEDPSEAVSGAHAVYTDVWASMGQEDETEQRNTVFKGYRVDEKLMAQASSGAIFLHCLPARRGYEVTDEVLDGSASRVWLQTANRLPATRGLLQWLCEQM